MRGDSVGANPVQRFPDALAQRVIVGTLSKSVVPPFIEIPGHTSFDFVVLDPEHGPGTVLSLQNLIGAAALTDLFPVARVKARTPSLISEVLDVGARGIQAPAIISKSDAQEVAQAARFAPLGMRGCAASFGRRAIPRSTATTTSPTPTRPSSPANWRA